MEACIILECRSEESPARELSLIHPTKGGKSLQALLPASQSAIACCASELEQDIAALEAEASWEDVHVWDMSVDDTYIAEAPARDQSLDLGQRELSGCHQESDHDSESDRESEDRRAAKVQANAKMVAEYGRPLEHRAWKGCAKSAWCDREDRHRGLCNHKASIPGPAVASIAGTVPYSRYQQHSQVPEDTLDNSCGLYQADDQNGKSLCAVADEHGVCRSAGYTAQLQHSMETSSMQSNCPSDQAVEEHVWREVSSGPELVWSSSASQQQQLLAMPLIYQPLVKDLGAPGIGSFLNSDSLCYLQETLDVPVPVVQPVTQAVHIEAYEVSSRSSNSAEDAFGRQGSSSEPACSAPSSPSCSSEAASILCYDTGSAAQAPSTCSKQPLQESGPLVDAAIPAIGGASSVDCCAKPNVAHGLLPLRKVHPTDCSTAACAIPVITSQPPTTAPAASVPAEKQTLLQRCGSSHSQLSQSSVDGLGRASVTQSAASDCPVTITPAAAVLTAAKSAAEVSAAAHPAAASQAPSMQRTARIKVKPRRADEPPRQLLEPSSPKAKKRMGSRMVSLPSAGHCCTQCGAVSTPVWRAGPAGPKTLCNACGVRYMKVARRSR